MSTSDYKALQASITKWMETSITLETAEARGLKQVSKASFIRNWTCREALYEFSRKHHTANVLVMLDERRAAIFA